VETLDMTPVIDTGVLDRIRAEAISNAAATSGEVSRRWVWLAEQAGRRQYSRDSKPMGSPW
jgi:hypothetical protein